MEYQNDTYQPISKYSSKKGSTILDKSAEDSVEKMLKTKVGIKPVK